LIGVSPSGDDAQKVSGAVDKAGRERKEISQDLIGS